MPRRSDPRNPLIINSANEFSEVGYLTGGTPMPVNVVAGGAGGGLSQFQERNSLGNWADVGYIAGGGTPLAVNIVAGAINGVNPTDGTLSELGTLKYSGTVGTVNVVQNVGTVYQVYGVDHGTIAISGGTLTGSNPSAGTLDVLTQIGTLPVLGTLGTLYYVTGLGMGTVRIEYGTVGVSAGTVTLNGLGTVRVDLGTIKISDGTLGTVNVYTKHDLHVYDNVGTFFTAGVLGGTVVAGVASKCVKVHYYSVETDGTFLAMFMDGAIDRGTLGHMWTFTQREGAIAPFVPYPAYLFKTTAGTPLFIGTCSSLNNFACAGTLNVHVIFTDDDTS